MADNSLVINPSDIDEIIKDYAQQRAVQSQITVEISKVNNLDVLVLLDIMNKKDPSVTELAPVVEAMLDGQTITFKKGTESIFSLSYNRGNGNALHMMFSDKPYLYDILQQTCYVLMLKKLTPHLEGSN